MGIDSALSEAAPLMTASTIDPASPPNLSHSIIHAITLNDRSMPDRFNFWNRLFVAVMIEAAKKLPKEKIVALVTGMPRRWVHG